MQDDPILATRLWGRRLPNPIGLAAGFDKNAEVIEAMFGLGFGAVEVGSVTPLPQPGNPRPRVFRLLEDEGVINRLGFNNEGVEEMAMRLKAYRGANPVGGAQGLLGVNLGKNKQSPDAGADYAAGARALAGFADYLVVNVSSPNTPGLRALQDPRELEAILSPLRATLPRPAPPLVLKVAPDLSDADKRDIAAFALEHELDGLIVSNTTISRPAGLRSAAREEAGGLSGRPLFHLATAALADFQRLTEGRIALIGTGGVASGADAYAKIRAGACMVQLYTALIFQGPDLVWRIKQDLAELLRRDGFESLEQAVGAGLPEGTRQQGL
jgi:dihydroorotate dehydrogenase